MTAPVTVHAEAARNALRQVKDPELDMNIIDLGLVYDVEIVEGEVRVKMTLTSPGCPAGPMITNDAYRVLRGLEGVKDVDIEIVWEPYWTPERMDPKVRALMGLYGCCTASSSAGPCRAARLGGSAAIPLSSAGARGRALDTARSASFPMMRNVARSCSAATPSRHRYSSRSAASCRGVSAFAPLTRRNASGPAPSAAPVHRRSSSRANSSSAHASRPSAVSLVRSCSRSAGRCAVSAAA